MGLYVNEVQNGNGTVGNLQLTRSSDGTSSTITALEDIYIGYIVVKSSDKYLVFEYGAVLEAGDFIVVSTDDTPGIFNNGGNPQGISHISFYDTHDDEGDTDTDDDTDDDSDPDPDTVIEEEETPLGELPEITDTVLEIPELEVPLDRLPETGGAGTLGFMGLGSSLAALGAFLKRKI